MRLTGGEDADFDEGLEEDEFHQLSPSPHLPLLRVALVLLVPLILYAAMETLEMWQKPSNNQLTIMRHALGLTRGETVYRNHFCVDEGHHDLDDILELCEEGLMHKIDTPAAWVDCTVFMVTNEGKAWCKGTIRKPHHRAERSRADARP